jgi:hypothetical protein
MRAFKRSPQSHAFSRKARALARDVASLRADIEHYRAELRQVFEWLLEYGFAGNVTAGSYNALPLGSLSAQAGWERATSFPAVRAGDGPNGQDTARFEDHRSTSSSTT